MLYVSPSAVSVTSSLVHVTVVAGEPVEVQVRVLVLQLYVRLDTVGGAVGEESYYVDRYLLYTTLYKCLEICQH